MIKIGSHVGMKAPLYLLGSANEAYKYGANAFMVYTGPPQSTIRKSIDDKVFQEMIKQAHEYMHRVGIRKEDVIIHAPYIMNLANPDMEKQMFARNFLASELNRTHKMGSKYIVLHPGNHLKDGSEVGIKRIIEGLDYVFSISDNDVHIALETMAGKGTEIGQNFTEIGSIIKGSKYSDRLKVCFDTCHVNDSGYDLLNDYDGVMSEFDEKIGLDKIAVFHINDSKNPLGAKKDRHENIGSGHIGFETILKIVYDERFKDIPKILETPYVDVAGKKAPPYYEEIAMLKNKKFVEILK